MHLEIVHRISTQSLVNALAETGVLPSAYHKYIIDLEKLDKETRKRLVRAIYNRYGDEFLETRKVLVSNFNWETKEAIEFDRPLSLEEIIEYLINQGESFKK